MADIQVILEVLGAEDMEKAARATVTLTNKVDSLGKQLKKGVIDNKQFQSGVQQLIKKNAQLGGGYQNLQKDVQRYAFSMQRRINDEKRAEAAVESVIRTTNNYTQATNRATVATTSAAEAAARHAAAQRMAGKDTNRFGMVAQQVGYQVGDFFVQVQSGTNALVAFGQQGTQLAGLLPGLKGAIIGIAISLGTMLGAAWMRTRKEVEETTTQLERVEEAISSLEGSTETLRMDLAQLAEVYGENAAKVRDYNTALAELRSAQARGRLGEEIQIARREVEQLTETLGEALGPKMQELADKVGLTFDEAVRLQEQLNTFSNLPIEQQGDAFIGIYQTLVDMGVPLDALPQGLRQALIEAGSTLEAMERLRVATEQAERAANGLANTDISSGVASAAASAENLARQFGLAYTAAYNLAKLGNSSGASLGFSGVGGTVTGPNGLPLGSGRTVGTFGAGGSVFGGNLRDLPSPEDIAGGGSSGGGGANPIEQAEAYLQKIQQEAELKQRLVGMSDEQVAVETRRAQLVNQLNGYEEGLGNQYSERIEQIIQMEAETRKLIEAEQQREQLMQTVTSNIESAFMSVVDGSKSVEDAFRSMLRNIILAVYQQQVAQPAATAIGSLAGKIFNFDGGGFTGYGSRSGGLDGKGGMMAMVHPNETVIDHTKGQSMGSVVVNNNFNISANGDESVKRIIRGEVPRITEATKAAVLDSKRRGGSYGRAF